MVLYAVGLEQIIVSVERHTSTTDRTERYSLANDVVGIDLSVVQGWHEG